MIKKIVLVGIDENLQYFIFMCAWRWKNDPFVGYSQI